jgi:hypothetical protein
MGSTGRRAAISVQVSTTSQAGIPVPSGADGGTSLETQEDACQAHCTTQGITLAAPQVYREVHSGVELWERPCVRATWR